MASCAAAEPGRDGTDFIELASAGRSGYVIYTAEDATASERTAARELQQHFKLVTGAELPIVAESAQPAARAFMVGRTRALRAAFPDLPLDSSGQDGIVLKTAGDTVFLAGGRPRGTLYAVYTFLEDFVGVRWWTSTASYIPAKPTLRIPRVDRIYSPRLQSREVYYLDAFNPAFAARLKNNGHFVPIPDEFGGHREILGFVHTFYPLLPPAKYFNAHPEWYSLIGGRRVGHGAQLCLTNDEMRVELTRNALHLLRANPGADMISISQNDGGNPCQCSNCQAVAAREGSQSGPIVEFVNKVATDIEKEFPDVLVETLAYHYSQKAPLRVKPRRNVLIRITSFTASRSQPLGEGSQNADFRRDIGAWSAITPRLFVWDYVTNFLNYLAPNPNWRTLGPNVRFLVGSNAVGLFEQGDAKSSGGDLVECRAWVLAHLMWDPSMDEWALIDEFLAGYYGSAAKYVRAYIDDISDALARSRYRLPIYYDDCRGFLTLKDLNEITKLFNQAAEAVKDAPVLSARVRRARMSVDHEWLLRYRPLKAESVTTGKPFLGPDDPVSGCEAFIANAHVFGMKYWKENNGDFASHESVLRAKCSQSPAAIPSR